MKRRLSQIYVLVVSLLTLAVLVYVFVSPLHSMRVDREGVAHLSPPVINPDSGDPIPLSALVRHFRGD